MQPLDTYKKWELWIESIALAGGLVGAVWAFYTYNDTKEKEYYSDFWNKKMELFALVSKSASNMATAATADSFNKARTEYWRLFFGELSLVEGPCVKRAMEVFSKCVPEAPIDEAVRLPYTKLQQPSYRLTVRLKQELGEGWHSPFSELRLRDRPAACEFEIENDCE
jgi:hypothetical protein